MSDEEDERAQWPEITEEELSYAQDFWNGKPSPDEEQLDDWLRVMEEIVGTIGYTYFSSFRLLERNNFNHALLLCALRSLYIHAMAEVNVVKRKRTLS
jgi:hypothetical protein